MLLLAAMAWGRGNTLRAQAPSPAPTPSAPTPASSITVPQSGLLRLPPANDPSSQKAGQLLEQMVAALGGQAYLNVQDADQQGRAYSFDSKGEASTTGAPFERFWRWPDQERVELTEPGISVGLDPIGLGIPLPIPVEKTAHVTVIYSGAQGYEISGQGTAAIPKDDLSDYLRRRDHSLPWVLRKWLSEPGIALFYEGSVLAERKQAEQVSLITAQNDAVTIAIDTLTHLPVQIVFTWRDPKYHDKNEEVESYDNYRPEQGIMTPFSVIRYYNGLPRSQRFVTSTKYNQQLPDTLFSAKVTSAPEKTSSKGKKK